MEIRLKWFEHVEIIFLSNIVKKVDEIDNSQIRKANGRILKNISIKETI